MSRGKQRQRASVPVESPAMRVAGEVARNMRARDESPRPSLEGGGWKAEVRAAAFRKVEKAEDRATLALALAVAALALACVALALA